MFRGAVNGLIRVHHVLPGTSFAPDIRNSWGGRGDLGLAALLQKRRLGSLFDQLVNPPPSPGHAPRTDRRIDRSAVPGAIPADRERPLPPQSLHCGTEGDPWDDAAGAHSPLTTAPATALRATEQGTVCTATRLASTDALLRMRAWHPTYSRCARRPPHPLSADSGDHGVHPVCRTRDRGYSRREGIDG
jgi:hypothetical protein